MEGCRPAHAHQIDGEQAGNTARVVRAGLVTPSFRVGGAERWMLDLASHTPGVQWVGCACLCDSAAPAMLDEMRRYAPVYGFTNEAIRPLLDTTDVLVCWGPHRLDQIIPAEYPGKVVVVSHAQEVTWTANVIRGAMSRATHWAAVSSAALEPYEGLVATENIAILWNGIDPQRCLPRRPRDETRHALGIGADQIVVGSIGRIANAKRPMRIARAVAQLGPPYWALLVGPWMTRDSTPAQAEQALAGRFTLVPETLHVGDLLAAMDVFVLASSAEGFGLAVCEALYAGVRVVSTGVGVLLDIAAEHGIQWEEVPVDPSAAELAAAIRATASLPESIAERRRTTVRHAIEDKYLASAMRRRWGEYLRRITRRDEG